MTSLSPEMESLGKELHLRMVGRDPTAFAEIAESHIPWVSEKLTKKYPALYDPDLIDTAIVDALYAYQVKPESYNPEKGSLANYLLMSAEGDLLNLLARDSKKSQISL